MKCTSIMNAHHHLLLTIASVNFLGVGSKRCTTDPTGPSDTVAPWLDRLSGWRMSPPVFPVLAMRPTVTSDNSRTAHTVQRAGRAIR